MKSKVLECAPFEAEHGTGDELEKEIRPVTEKYDIKEKLVLTIADNAGDIQLALKQFGIPKIGCCAHKLNLAAKKAIETVKKIEALKTKVAMIVRTTKVSDVAKKVFKKCKNLLGIKYRKVLISYVKTRWNSFYNMIQRVQDMKDVMVLYFDKYKVDNTNKLTDADWSLIESLLPVFRPLYLATNELSAEKYTTLSKVIPMIRQLMSTYSANRANENTLLKEVRKTILESLKAKFKDLETDSIYTNSSIFDPRFKDLVFSTKAKALAAVSQAKNDAINANLENSNDEIGSDSDFDDFAVTEIDSNKNEADELWVKFDAKIAKASTDSKPTNHVNEIVELEMKQYLESPNIERKLCPIKWWATVGQKQYPYLFKIAKKYQCMNATSVPSERVFSKAGTIINKKRCALGKKTANMLITLNHNL